MWTIRRLLVTAAGESCVPLARVHGIRTGRFRLVRAGEGLIGARCLCSAPPYGWLPAGEGVKPALRSAGWRVLRRGVAVGIVSCWVLSLRTV